jgi:hypothetical protein
MTVTIGGRGAGLDLVVLVVFVKEFREQRRFLLFAGVDHVNCSAPTSAAYNSIMSSLRLWTAVTISPCKKRKTHNVRGAAVELGTRRLSRWSRAR